MIFFVVSNSNRFLGKPNSQQQVLGKIAELCHDRINTGIRYVLVHIIYHYDIGIYSSQFFNKIAIDTIYCIGNSNLLDRYTVGIQLKFAPNNFCTR